MANTKSAPAKDKTKSVDSKALSAASKKQDQLMQTLNIIEADYGDDAPFELEKSIQKTQIHLATSATSMLLAGRELVRIKEHTQHGDFQNVVEKRLMMNPNTARRFMSAAIKFSGMKQITNAVKGQTTLLELITLDDDDLKALDDGATVAGLTLDEIDRMPTSELRTKLREYKEELKKNTESTDKILARKNKKIDELTKQLDQRPATGWNINTEMINTDVVSSSGKILEQLDALDQFREEIVGANDPDKDFDAEFEAMAINYYDTIAQTFDRFNEVIEACEEVFGAVKNKAVAG